MCTRMNLSAWSVAQSCPALCDLMDCSPPGSSIHGVFQARILEWVAISFSRGSTWPRDRIHVSCTCVCVCVCVYINHFALQQKSAQHCESNTIKKCNPQKKKMWTTWRKEKSIGIRKNSSVRKRTPQWKVINKFSSSLSTSRENGRFYWCRKPPTKVVWTKEF